MKSGKWWMSVFLVPVFALLQVAVIHMYRKEAEKEAEVYERQLEIYNRNRQAVIEMTGRQSPEEIDKSLEEESLGMQDSGEVDVMKIKRVKGS